MRHLLALRGAIRVDLGGLVAADGAVVAVAQIPAAGMQSVASSGRQHATARAWRLPRRFAAKKPMEESRHGGHLSGSWSIAASAVRARSATVAPAAPQ